MRILVAGAGRFTGQPPLRRSGLALLLLSLAGLAGCATRRRFELHERPPLPDGAVRLVHFGGGSRSFFQADGRRCGPPPWQPAGGLVGWRSTDSEPACLHDSYDHGQEEASLELRFRTVIQADGPQQLLSRGGTVDVLGCVQARGAPKVDIDAEAVLELEARAPGCRAVHRQRLAYAVVDGPWTRTASFDGWIALPDLVLQRCIAGEVLEVRLRLVGTTVRGLIEVSSFGLLAARSDDLHEAFALRPRPDLAPELVAPPAGTAARAP